MKKLLLSSIVAFILGPVWAQSPLRVIVIAETQFAQLAQQKGSKTAFLTYLAPNSVVFTAGKPTNGLKHWQEAPSGPELLSLKPISADAAASGDFGYTTGPWELRPKTPQDKPTEYGHYVSVWKKQANGRWKVAVEVGISHPAPATPPVNALQASTDVRSVSNQDTTKSKADLLAADQDLIKTLQADGTEAAYKKHLAARARFYRMDQQPVVDRAAIDALLKEPVTLGFEPVQASVSLAGDMGYVYGNSSMTVTAEGKPTKRNGNYLRIWKKDAQGHWKIVLDLINLVPTA